MSQGITNVHNSKEKRFKEIHAALETMHNTAFTMVSSDPNPGRNPNPSSNSGRNPNPSPNPNLTSNPSPSANPNSNLNLASPSLTLTIQAVDDPVQVIEP